MVEKTVKIVNPSGLHLRPAAVLAKEATKCRSDVRILYNNHICNAKSSLNIMALVIKKGTEITITCEGENEQEDLEKIVALVERGLGELDT